MLQGFEAQASTADKAIAIYEDSISYFMPPTFEAEKVAADEAAEHAIVRYYEAA